MWWLLFRAHFLYAIIIYGGDSPKPVWWKHSSLGLANNQWYHIWTYDKIKVGNQYTVFPICATNRRMKNVISRRADKERYISVFLRSVRGQYTAWYAVLRPREEIQRSMSVRRDTLLFRSAIDISVFGHWHIRCILSRISHIHEFFSFTTNLSQARAALEEPLRYFAGSQIRSHPYQ